MSDNPFEDDMLAAIFARQRHLQHDIYHTGMPCMPDEEKVQYIKDMILAAEDELHEALAEVDWKPWSKGNSIHHERMAGELVDVLHFFVNLCLVIDLKPEELFTRYWAKTQVNIDRQRQAGGYNQRANKCPVCGRALDDPGVTCRVDEPGRFSNSGRSGRCDSFNDEDGVGEWSDFPHIEEVNPI